MSEQIRDAVVAAAQGYIGRGYEPYDETHGCIDDATGPDFFNYTGLVLRCLADAVGADGVEKLLGKNHRMRHINDLFPSPNRLLSTRLVDPGDLIIWASRPDPRTYNHCAIVINTSLDVGTGDIDLHYVHATDRPGSDGYNGCVEARSFSDDMQHKRRRVVYGMALTELLDRIGWRDTVS